MLLAGTKDGDVWMWKMPDGSTKTFQSFGHPCNTGRVMPDGKNSTGAYIEQCSSFCDMFSLLFVVLFTLA